MRNSTLFSKIQHHKFTKWMNSNKWKYFDYQLKVLKTIEKKKDLLIVSPTGTGKTIAGFLPAIIDITDEKQSKLHTIYISPLKSLAKDIKRNISEPIDAMNMNISLEIGVRDFIFKLSV